jgi:very-short-patch-repair endonuclease
MLSFNHLPHIVIASAYNKIMTMDANDTINTMKTHQKFPSMEGWRRNADWVVKRNTKNYLNLPYNSTLKEKAKELRKAGNLSEVLLWNRLKHKQFKGLDFDRQKIIGNYIVDFYCGNLGVIIEIDGYSHDNKANYDKKRDKFLQGLGLIVIHVLDSDIKCDIESVVSWLNNHPAFGTPSVNSN